MFISCRTSPSAITLVASASTAMMRMSCASTIIWKAREYRKSPTSTLAGLPNVSFAVALPRRSAEPSTTSSCSNVAVWMNSTTAARLNRCWPVYPQCAARQQQKGGAQAIAACAVVVARHLADQWHARIQSQRDGRVDRQHVCCNDGESGRRMGEEVCQGHCEGGLAAHYRKWPARANCRLRRLGRSGSPMLYSQAVRNLVRTVVSKTPSRL